jgi:NAD(P)H-hydrate epimerase
MAVPVISIAQMRKWERATWAAGQTEEAVIRRVGELVAQRARKLTRPGECVVILAGRGHNGDDARCAQPHLADRAVEVLEVTDPAAAAESLAEVLARPPALIIDGLFGIGLNRPLSSEWAQLIERVNQGGAAVLAVDVPSGLEADTGEPMSAAIRAAVTLTLGAPKAGLLLQRAWPFVGRLEVAPEIGLVKCPCSSQVHWTLPEDFAAFPPRRPVAGHKGAFGHLVIFAGSVGYHGAAVLAARAAQRAQPGLITLFTLPAVYGPVASQLQAVMVHPWGPGLRLPATTTAVLVGPGLASPGLPPACREEVVRLWQESPLPVLVDASALDWLPEGPTCAEAVRVITPHPGEGARMLRTTPGAVQADRGGALRELSRRYGHCYVVLKGYQSLVGRGDEAIYVNSSGNPFLAQGGSGDVLAGYLAGWLALPAGQNDPLKAVRYAVWQHGAAADQLMEGARNWVVEELVEALGRVAV